ncbi:MAG: hypothetical protein AMR96_02710 [Candidatus Adiutrix intracellularis]|nr:MAG: hypothetical protein AMR96_02710 [Candidatus Adiutrix intracellularis]
MGGWEVESDGGGCRKDSAKSKRTAKIAQRKASSLGCTLQIIAFLFKAPINRIDGRVKFINID